MRTRTAARATGVAAGLAAVAVLALGCSSDEPDTQPSATTTPASTSTAGGTTAPTVPTTVPPTTTAANQVISVTVAGGKVTPAPTAVDVKLGATVVIEVTVDVADELHVHGYDKTLALSAGQPGRLELTAAIPGQFEVELHHDHLLLFTLRVS